MKPNLVESGRLLPRAICCKKLYFCATSGHGAKHLLDVDRTSFAAEHRHSWIGGDISDAHRLALNVCSLGLNVWHWALLNHFAEELPEPAEICLQVEALLDEAARLVSQSPTQFRIDQQSLNRFSNPFDVAGVGQKPCLFVRHQFHDSFQSRCDHGHADGHGLF